MALVSPVLLCVAVTIASSMPTFADEQSFELQSQEAISQEYATYSKKLKEQPVNVFEHRLGLIKAMFLVLDTLIKSQPQDQQQALNRLLQLHKQEFTKEAIKNQKQDSVEHLAMIHGLNFFLLNMKTAHTRALDQ